MKNTAIQTGIWLDRSEAFFVTFQDGEMSTCRVKSNIDFSRIGGGARSNVPYGPMDKTSESKLLEKHLQQEKNYFADLLEALGNSQEVFLFGPAQTKERFKDFLNDAYKFKGVVAQVEAAGKMTENQQIAKVREFFKITHPA